MKLSKIALLLSVIGGAYAVYMIWQSFKTPANTVLSGADTSYPLPQDLSGFEQSTNPTIVPYDT